MKLLGNTVLVSIHEEKDDVTGSGLIMSTKEDKDVDYVRASVVQSHTGFYDSGQWIIPKMKTGDEVIISKLGGQDLSVKGNEYRLLREPDVLVILDEDEIES